jgi:hypothetical protein
MALSTPIPHLPDLITLTPRHTEKKIGPRLTRVSRGRSTASHRGVIRLGIKSNEERKTVWLDTKGDDLCQGRTAKTCVRGTPPKTR